MKFLFDIFCLELALRNKLYLEICFQVYVQQLHEASSKLLPKERLTVEETIYKKFKILIHYDSTECCYFEFN